MLRVQLDPSSRAKPQGDAVLSFSPRVLTHGVAIGSVFAATLVERFHADVVVVITLRVPQQLADFCIALEMRLVRHATRQRSRRQQYCAPISLKYICPSPIVAA